jgi:hypothetical protein
MVLVRIRDMKRPMKEVSTGFQVHQLLGSRNAKVAQRGLVSDGTGMASFVIFRSSKLPNLEVGRSYRVHGVFVENSQGRPSMRFTSRSEIESIPDIDLTATEEAKEGIPIERTLPSGQATLFAFGT